MIAMQFETLRTCIDAILMSLRNMGLRLLWLASTIAQARIRARSLGIRAKGYDRCKSKCVDLLYAPSPGPKNIRYHISRLQDALDPAAMSIHSIRTSRLTKPKSIMRRRYTL